MAAVTLKPFRVDSSLQKSPIDQEFVLGASNDATVRIAQDLKEQTVNYGSAPAPTLYPIGKNLDYVLDIRNGANSSPLDLRAKTLDGLCEPLNSKSFPSLLLWDGTGQKLYNEILCTSEYYPFQTENELLKESVQEIAGEIIRSGSRVLLELGAGNMHKTLLLLSALDKFDKPLTYYALDVDKVELESSISDLRARLHLRNIDLRGLVGTYEDGATWLAAAREVRGVGKSLIWLGSSIANFKLGEAAQLLRQFMHGQGKQDVDSLLIAVDGCRDMEMIKNAYDTPDGKSRRFIKHALRAARRHLGPESAKILDECNWNFESHWNGEELRYETCLCAARRLVATVADRKIEIEEGELVHVIGSGKWTRSDVDNLCSGQGLDITSEWSSRSVDYGIYLLQPK